MKLGGLKQHVQMGRTKHHPEMTVRDGGGKHEGRGREGRVFSLIHQKSCASVHAFI